MTTRMTTGQGQRLTTASNSLSLLFGTTVKTCVIPSCRLLELEMPLASRSGFLSDPISGASSDRGRFTVTQAKMIHFKKAMEDKRRELLGKIHSHSSQIKIAESEHDPIDQVQSMHIREENATHLGRRSRILADIDLSLHAISDGSYGLCIDCEEPISLKRLESIPWASRCIRCQQTFEFLEAEEQQAA